MKEIIGILVNRAAPQESYNLPGWTGPEILVFDREGISWRKETISGWILSQGHWRETAAPFPGAVYNRRYSAGTKLVERLERYIGPGKVFNHVTRFNKWDIYHFLRQAKIGEHHPLTWLYSREQLPALLDQHRRLILKPTAGQKGRGVYLLERRTDGAYCFYVNLNLAKQITKDPEVFLDNLDSIIQGDDYLVQECIPLLQINKRNHELRMYVQKNYQGQWTVVDGFCKISFPYAYISNFYSELRGIPEVLAQGKLLNTSIYADISGICLEAARELEKSLGHLGEISVDLALDHQKRPWIVEVNGRTQKELLYEIKGTPPFPQVFKNPLDYAAFLLQKKLKRLRQFSR